MRSKNLVLRTRRAKHPETDVSLLGCHTNNEEENKYTTYRADFNDGYIQGTSVNGYLYDRNKE